MEKLLTECDIIPTSFSLWNMFLQADLVVKAVIIGLVLASIWSWTIVFNKWLTLRKLHHEGDILLERFHSQSSFEMPNAHIHESSNPFTTLFLLATKEWRRIKEDNSSVGMQKLIHERILHLMNIVIEKQRNALQSHMGFLASVGSTAPFIGLFGTVWGIMHSFQCIAATKNTNLSVVAPGIAEALFATAIGLIVAIPAVVAYNKISLSINSYMSRLENFAYELSALCLSKVRS